MESAIFTGRHAIVRPRPATTTGSVKLLYKLIVINYDAWLSILPARMLGDSFGASMLPCFVRGG